MYPWGRLQPGIDSKLERQGFEQVGGQTFREPPRGARIVRELDDLGLRDLAVFIDMPENFYDDGII
jgi:hypothetical protein